MLVISLVRYYPAILIKNEKKVSFSSIWRYLRNELKTENSLKNVLNCDWFLKLFDYVYQYGSPLKSPKIFKNVALRANWINQMKVKFLYTKHFECHILWFSAIIQLHLDYVCSTMVSQKLKQPFQIMRNKWIQFCLVLGTMYHVSRMEFKDVNCLQM